MKKSSYIFFLLLILFLLDQAKATVVVINSQNWEDVYSGILYAKLNNMNAYFLTSSNPSGLLKLLSDNEIILIESKSPFLPNFKSLLENNKYKVTMKEISDSSDLSIDSQNVYVIGKENYQAALLLAPLARVENSWVYIVDDNNINIVLPKLQGKNVILVGYLKRSIKDALEKYKKEEIIEPNKFKLSLSIAERFLQKKPTTQVLIVDGRSMEDEMFQGHSPLILVGPNLLPKETFSWLLNKGIKTCVVIGSELTYVGEQIRAQSNKTIGVLIKFGQATYGSPVYALSMFPLPTPELKLEVSSIIYDPLTKKLYIIFKNSGNIGLFELTSFKILSGAREITSSGDEKPTFIGVGESFVATYSISIPPEELANNLTVELFVSYGESQDSLDLYLTNAGKFGPPLTKNLEIKEIKDDSLLNITKITYYKNYGRIGVEVINVVNISTYFVVKIPGIRVQGVPTPISSEMSFIGKGTKEIFIPVKLDEIDIKENSNLRVILTYGENKDALLKILDVSLPLEVSSGLLPTGLFILSPDKLGIVAIVIIIVIVVLFLLRRFRKKTIQPSVTQTPTS
jgi:hypothetical protein